MLKQMYLVAYNCAAMLGWALVLYITVTSYLNNDTPTELWSNVGYTLTIVQTSAALEMLHSLLKIVRSPFLGTFLQVMSRLYLVHVCTLRSTEAQAHWSLYLMVVSWSCVEIPRYLFYTCAQLMESKKIPSIIFNMRYSLFMVLYPTGITGEMVQMLITAQALRNGTATGWMLFEYGPMFSVAASYRFISFTWIGYLAGGPYMWNNMYSQRKRATKNRIKALNPPKPKPVLGVQWPLTGGLDKKTGLPKRSTLSTNQKIWVAAFDALDGEENMLSASVTNWRKQYKKWVNKSVIEGCKRSSNASEMARNGLSKASDLFQFYATADDETSKMSLKEAVDLGHGAVECPYWTYCIEGSLRDSYTTGKIVIEYAGESGTPYYQWEKKQAPLEGEALKRQLKKWVDYGTIEKDASDAITLCIDQPEKYCNLLNHTFVILGATSAMGPIDVLLRYGCTVICVDIDFEHTWDILLNKVDNSPGRIILPVRKNKTEGIRCLANRKQEKLPLDMKKYTSDVGLSSKKNFIVMQSKDLESKPQSSKAPKRFGPLAFDLSKYCGSNLLNEVPDISRWLKECIANKTLIADDTKVTIGNYTYLDGELHVRLSVACNELISKLATDNDTLTIAFLCTPTDCHLIPKEAYQAAEKNYQNSNILFKMFGSCLGLKKNLMEPIDSEDGAKTFYMVDGIVPQQGPNYALAKRMQHWMAIVQRGEKHTVASNVAPSTATISVTHNFLFKMAYGGMHCFKPMEVMWPCTSNALMGSLLLHDICNEDGPNRGATSLSETDDHFTNPLELFSVQGCHGGLWRTGYALNSTSITSVLIYLLSNYHVLIIGLLSFLMVAFSWLFGVTDLLGLEDDVNKWDPLMNWFGWMYGVLRLN